MVKIGFWRWSSGKVFAAIFVGFHDVRWRKKGCNAGRAWCFCFLPQAHYLEDRMEAAWTSRFYWVLPVELLRSEVQLFFKWNGQKWWNMEATWRPPRFTEEKRSQTVCTQTKHQEQAKTAWCFGTWILWLPNSWDDDPIWRTPSFFRGVGLNHQLEKIQEGEKSHVLSRSSSSSSSSSSIFGH